MDKTWMSKDRMSKEYEDGVEQFIVFAISHASNPKLIKCPCQVCGNLMFETPKGIRDHMFIRGVDQSYKIWSWHGEVADIGGTTSREVNFDQSPKYEEVQETLQMVNAAYDPCTANHDSFTCLTSMLELTVSCIILYMRQLYDHMKAEGLLQMFGFINPAIVSLAGNLNNQRKRDERSRNIADRLVKAKKNQLIIMPYNPAGQSTISLEFLEHQVPQLDTIIVPISGGGLISGVALAAKAINPAIRVLAAEPEGANDAAQSKAAGRIITLSETNTVAWWW
ncbi:uncharacterized protein LOC110763563 isoform X2 [Prunus avium]|uniref:Uncharacterized protein LOC110763563 isoform X2 n=1 Tax=Prunus avium TaxID=42229 RepID=A0A6P5T4H6_PRUAV|nr:uncharacterized protein LOC110763563 isoform X2 [Prunus avium]